MADIMEITSSGGTSFDFDSTDFENASQDLASMCDLARVDSVAGAPEATRAPTAGGSELTFASEFEAAGIQPGVIGDSVEEHAAYAAEKLCNPAMTDTSFNFQKTVEIFVGQGLSEEEAKSVGKGADFVRLVVKYNCPDRSESVESLLPYGR